MAVGPDHVPSLGRPIEETRPEVILVPWLLDAAPEHRVVSHMLWLADRIQPLPPCEVWGYQVSNPVLANGLVNITAQIDEKIELVRMYASQIEWLRRCDHQARGLAAWNSRFLPSKARDSIERSAELFCALPLAEHLALVERFYFGDFGRCNAGKQKLAEAMLRLHVELAGKGS